MIDGEGISIRADLVTKNLSVVEEGKAADYEWPELERNDTYRAQHQAILSNDSSLVCTFEQGLETMTLIDRVRSFGN